MQASPVRYTPDVEDPSPDEAETIDGLNAALREILETTSADYGHAVRSVHAKSHGILDGDLTVLPDLAPEYAQGLFATAGTYRVVIRISTNPGDILDDSISVPRGLALKVIGVHGGRLPGSEDNTTQDFILVNGPAFAAPDAKTFLGNLKLLGATTDRAEWAKKALSAVLRGSEAVIETVGLKSPMLMTMGGAPNVHPLGETYYSQTPFRYGDLIAKFALAPVSPNVTALTGEKIDTSGRRDAIREDVDAAASAASSEWEFRVQLCRDLDAMPVEDASVLWREEDSPFVPVARIVLPAQRSWTDEKVARVDDGTRFSVWTGLSQHQPLGSVNRVRRATYEMSAGFRSRVNRCPINEPV